MTLLGNDLFGPSARPSDAVLAAEAAVVGTALTSRAAAEEATELVQATDLYDTAHIIVFEAISGLVETGQPVDETAVLRELTRRGDVSKVGGPQLLEFGRHASRAALAFHARTVTQDAARRRVLAFAERTLQRTLDLGFDAATDVDLLRKDFETAVAAVVGGEPPTIGEVLLDVLDELERPLSAEDLLPPPYMDLEMLVPGFRPGQLIVYGSRPSIGKALALDTPIPTPTGWTTMGDLQVGQQVLGADGMPTTVTFATEVMLGRTCYEVEFSDGATIVADADHQWFTTTRSSRKSEYQRRLPKKGGPLSRDQSKRFVEPGVKTTKEILETLRCIDGRLNHAVPVTKPVDLPQRELAIPPYVLGAWLGDGTSNGSGFTSADPEVIKNLEAEGMDVRSLQHPLAFSIQLLDRDPRAERDCLVCGVKFTPKVAGVRTCGRSCGGRLPRGEGPVTLPGCPDCGRPYTGTKLCRQCREHHGSFMALLRRLDLVKNKHIPAAYLRASEAQRHGLLAGLLDTDGFVNSSGTVQLALTHKSLAFGAWELILSLGYRATMTSKTVPGRSQASSTCYMVTFTPANQVFRLARKAQRVRVGHAPRSQVRLIRDIREIPSVPMRCIQVDNAEHLYLAGRNWIPTHNTLCALDAARAAAIHLGLPTLMFSLEMSRPELMHRLLAAEATVPLDRFTRHQLTADDWDRIAKAKDRVEAAPLVIDDSPSCTLARVRARLRGMRSRFGECRLLIVDYLGLLDAPRAESRERAVAEMARGLKLIAKEFGVPVLLLAQLNRASEQRHDKRPMLSDLRESGGIEADADVVVLLHREDFYDPESPRAGELDLLVMKNRHGARGTATVAFQGQYSRASDMWRGR